MPSTSENLKNILIDEKELKEVREKSKKIQKNSKSSFNPMIILLLITSSLMIYFAYVAYGSKKDDNGIKKEEHERIINKLIAFEKENDELKLKLEKTIEQSKSISEELYLLKEQKPQIETELAEKVVTINKVDKKNFNTVYNSNNTKLLRCYDYTIGDFNPTQTCEKKLKKFVTENKDALRFELVAVISKEDEASFKNVANHNLDFLINGLSIKRITEMNWQIKKELNEKTIITSNNFYVKSKKGNSGVLLKAYF